MRNRDLPTWVFPALLTWLCIRSFGVLTPWMGSCADDWRSWITGLPFQATIPRDRTTLHFLQGAFLILAGILPLEPLRQLQANNPAVPVGLTVGVYFQNANPYRKKWNINNQSYSQPPWGTGVAGRLIDRQGFPVLNYNSKPGEQLMIIEVFSKNENVNKAADLSLTELKDDFFRPSVCGMEQSLEDSTTLPDSPATAIFEELGCQC